MTKRSTLALSAGILASALLLSGCGGGEGGGEGKDAGSQDLRIVAAEPQAGLDPAIAVTQASLRMTELMYDTLVDYDGDNNLIPMVAESWKLSDDGLTYVFTIRENAAFSDGTTITADDVVFSLERAGASESLTASFAVVDSIEATGEKEVTVTLSTPSRVFLNSLAATGQAAILSKAAVEADPDYFTQPVATSGPWSLKEFVPSSHATLVANQNYWNKGYPVLQTIEYTFSTDGTANATALETGTVDMTYNMTPADAVRLDEAGSIQYFEAPSAGLVSWGMDKTKAPFDNVDVRQAVAYMVPRQDRLDTCWEGIGPVSFGDLIFPDQSFYVEGEQRFDVSKDEALRTAAKLLDGAGWVEGPDGVRVSQGVSGLADGTPFEMTVPYENGWAQARCNTEMLQQYLLPLGITVTPEAYDAATFWTDVAAEKFTFYHGGNSYATTDIYFAQTFMCDGSANDLLAKWCDPKVDKLITQAQETSDLDEAAALYRQVQDIILDEQPMITTGAQYAVIGTSPKLSGFYPRADASNRALI
jgi:peptide/nickel transport system substrate-binding protein